MKKIRRQDGTYVLLTESGPYHVVSKEIDPYNRFDIEELNLDYENNPEDFGSEIDEISLVPLHERESHVRQIRNQMLSNTDWTQMLDIPEEKRNAYKGYRQQLRDLTYQEGFPDNVVWPEEPNNIDS